MIKAKSVFSRCPPMLRDNYIVPKETLFGFAQKTNRNKTMAEGGKSPPSPAAADTQLFGLLSNLLQQVESLTNQEEVELRAKIEALGLEVRKLPSKSAQHLDEMEIAKELDKLSAKLDDVDELISSTMAADPQVRTLLSSTADVWLPVITATSDERRNFTSVAGEDSHEVKGKSSE